MLAICLSFSAFAASLSGIVTGAAGAKQVKLYSLFGGLPSLQDSVLLKADGSFQLNRKGDWPRGIYQLEVGTYPKLNLVLANEAKPMVSWKAGDPTTSEFTNSPENKAYQAYFKEKSAFRAAQQNLEKAMQSLGARQDLSQEQLQAEASKYRARFDSLQQAEQAFYDKARVTYKGTYAGKVAESLFVKKDIAKDEFFPLAMLADEELTRSDVIIQRLNAYLIKYMEQDIESYRRELKYLAELHKDKAAKGKELLLAGLIDIFRNSGVTMSDDQEASNWLIRQYVTQFPNSANAKRYAATLSPEIGDLAPDLTFSNPDGKNMSLSSLKGKVVLLDFWASWCGPCRRENPNVVKAYERFHPKGFEIFSVSLDQNKDKWVQAISADKLTWPHHVSDLLGWRSAAAAVYKVNAIPAAFLLDREGRIVAKSLRGQALEDKLAELLDK